MKTWFLIPTIAFCYNLKETDDKSDRRFQIRSSIDVNWETKTEDFENDFQIEIERLLCNDILRKDTENCSFVESGWYLDNGSKLFHKI